jgi:ribosomal protein S18 acetylase RimI-like enzyme
MIITRLQALTTLQLYEVDKLHKDCKQADGNAIAIYRHLIEKRHPIACNVLCYQDKRLLGYLRTYFFYADACEVALMVAPEHRRQGIASRLFQEILPVMIQENIVSLIFSTPHEANSAWLSHLNFTYRNSEYQMQYDRNQPVKVLIKSALIRPANIADIPILCAIDDTCFPNKKPDPEALFLSLLRTPNCDLFVLEQNGEVIGKAHIFTESDRVRLTDIGILPAARGQGFGATLIKHCINHALVRNKTKIFLDVETTNERALSLYTKLGFIITNTQDYWRSPDNAADFGLSVFTQHQS